MASVEEIKSDFCLTLPPSVAMSLALAGAANGVYDGTKFNLKALVSS